ncbi:hypothetical protein BDP27DRAFT_1370435 [Rhodocollybia butyracea]|uniref:Uncharacterized protein n=1 Tax=Rhodocollybia butyracea TaxID=206335 RepID=A0A9P5TZ76_9AGAR|nr:hypothetical protein BDP27DRAFT_1370435 [Rhodocollybia butyracea]
MKLAWKRGEQISSIERPDGAARFLGACGLHKRLWSLAHFSSTQASTRPTRGLNVIQARCKPHCNIASQHERWMAGQSRSPAATEPSSCLHRSGARHICRLSKDNQEESLLHLRKALRKGTARTLCWKHRAKRLTAGAGGKACIFTRRGAAFDGWPLTAVTPLQYERWARCTQRCYRDVRKELLKDVELLVARSRNIEQKVVQLPEIIS